MTESKEPRSAARPTGHDLARTVGEKEARKLRARRRREESIWFGLGMFGMVGWSVAAPTLLLLALGVWIDRRWPGPYSWTLMLLLLGIGLGCLNAWYWVSRERRQIEADLADLLREDESASAKEGKQ
jgi:ATP synthase protein I